MRVCVFCLSWWTHWWGCKSCTWGEITQFEFGANWQPCPQLGSAFDFFFVVEVCLASTVTFIMPCSQQHLEPVINAFAASYERKLGILASLSTLLTHRPKLVSFWGKLHKDRRGERKQLVSMYKCIGVCFVSCQPVFQGSRVKKVVARQILVEF